MTGRNQRRRAPAVVAILGVDGSGKTTQAKLIAAWLRDRGTPAAYFENPGGRPVIDAIARRAGRRDGRDLLGGPGLVTVESTIRWIAIARALAVARVTGRVAVMDRYGPCQHALMATRGDRGRRLVLQLFRPFPTPDVVCFLTLPAELAQHRVALRGQDQEDVAYLAAFAAAYRALPEFASFVEIDASGSVDQVQQALRAAIAPAINQR